jgi:hypothetical protein
MDDGRVKGWECKYSLERLDREAFPAGYVIFVINVRAFPAGYGVLGDNVRAIPDC